MASDLAMGVVLGAVAKTSFDKTFRNASKSVGGLGKTVKATQNKLNQVGAYKKTQGALAETKNKLGATQREAVRLRKAMKAKPGNATLARRLAKTRKEAAKLGSTVDQQTQKLRKQAVGLRKAGLDTRHLAQAETKLTHRLEEQQRSMVRANRTMEKRKSALGEMRHQLGKLAGMTLFGKKAIGSAIDFEDAMAGVKQQVKFDSPKEFRQMGEDIRQLSLKVPVARNELAALVAQGRSGYALADKDLLSYARDAAKLSVALNMSTKEAGDMLGGWRATFQLSEKGAMQLADKVAMLGKTYGATTDDLNQFIDRIGPSGKAMGLNAGQVAALGASMMSLGEQSTDARRGIKVLTATMAAGAAATPRQQKAFQALGLDASDMAKRMSTDAGGALVTLLGHLRKLPKAERNAQLQNLFGRQGITALAPLVDGVDTLKKSLASVADETQYAGTVQKQYLARAKDTKSTLAVGKNAWNTFSSIIGNTFLPTLKTAIGIFITITGKISAFSNKFPHLTHWIVGATTALIGFKSAMAGGKLFLTFLPSVGKLGTAFKLLVPGIALAKKAVLGMSVVMKAFNLSLLASPIGWIITGIAALSAAAYLIYKNWGPISDWFKKMWSDVKDITAAVFGWIVKFIKGTLGAVKHAWDATVGAIGKLWHGLKHVTGNVGSSIAKHARNVAGDVKRGWKMQLQFIGKAWHGLKSVAGKVGSWIGRHSRNMAGNVKRGWKMQLQFIGKAWRGLKSVAGSVGSWIGKHAGGIADRFTKAWKTQIGMVVGLWKWLKSKIKPIIDWATEKFEWVASKWSKVKGALGGAWHKVAGATVKVGQTVAMGATLGATVAAPASGAPGPQAVARASRATGSHVVRQGDHVTNSNNTTIQVHAAPGMDERQLAKHVRKELDERDRQNAVRRRSRLGDLD